MRARDSLGLETIFSRKERAVFLQKSMRVLFITEYLMLVEYVEVVLPFVYSLHRIALFGMPNSAYYPSLAGLSSTELYSSVINVLAYGSLEFMSLILAIVVLKRSLGFSPLSQLAFVLEIQAGMVQSKLSLWTVYITQVSLAHLGE
ncbi:hypothetical protein BBJ29_008787 [Phytophthora kernoviae]|uniref:Uncharacterized protein n=2 Tax=Phytophthora kernoviae TaxID=325452 RepID=A0A3F2RF67_9STRA|nr:hypothetical protein G195_010770 [Phytophthora kernoviae 00238/432]RLN51758.1 hypothetical protein BBJ29_008787 [Phytophthora kernoviae]RLN54120.1 hypothetical protein BBP00_00009061 [Phytophthora kernoviae]